MQIACLGHTEADAMYAAAAFLRDQIEASKNQREVLLAIVSILEDGVELGINRKTLGRKTT